MPLGKPKIVAAAQSWGHGATPAENLLDDSPLTEYASDGKGTETFVEFDFGVPVTIGGSATSTATIRLWWPPPN